MDQAAGQMADGSEQVQVERHGIVQGGRTTANDRVAVPLRRRRPQPAQLLKNALSAHSAWTSRLRAAIGSRKLDIPVSTIRTDNQCQFGKWLYGEYLSKDEKQTENYRSVKQLHAQFHQAAATVAQLAISGQREAAEKAMSPASDYGRVSSAFTAALNEWSAAV